MNFQLNEANFWKIAIIKILLEKEKFIDKKLGPFAKKYTVTFIRNLS